MSGSSLAYNLRGSIATTTGDGPDVDAFGRLRVSDPVTLFDSKLSYDAQALLWDEAQTSGAGTTSAYSSNTASVTMSVGASTAGTRVRQSRRRMAYQPGKSQALSMTFTFGAAAAGITRRVGLFDEKNGIYLQQTSAGLAVGLRSFATGSAVDTVIPQADWNIDRMDGTGPSGVVLDATKSQIFQGDLEWLGVGRVRYALNIGGNLHFIHEQLHANRVAGVFASTANLPVRYEISNDGTGAAASLVCICSAVVSEGGSQFTGFQRSADRGTVPLVTQDDDGIYPLIGIRLKPTHLGATVRLLASEVLCTSTATYRWGIYYNPTFTGSTLDWVGLANSAVDVVATASNSTKITGGTLLASGYGEDTVQGTSLIGMGSVDVPLGSTIAGVSDTLVLGVQKVTGTTETLFGALRWAEQV